MAESGFSKSSQAEQRMLPPENKSWPIWPWLVLLLVLVAILIVHAASSSSVPTELRGTKHPAVGTKLTTFQLEPLTGKGQSVSESALEGKVTLVNFWGPWCPACLIEFPHLMEVEKHFRSDARFQFFSISSNADPRDETGLAASTEEFLKQQQADFPTYCDPQGDTARSFIMAAKVDDFGFPSTLLIGPDGTLRGLWLGYELDDEKSIQQAIELALSQTKPSS